MHPRITRSCVVAALIISAGDALAIECRSEKGEGYPWAWRQIDGKRCWYKGAPGMNKKHLHWAAITRLPATPTHPASNVIEDTAERELLLQSYWPPMPQADVFSERFDAARGMRR